MSKVTAGVGSTPAGGTTETRIPRRTRTLRQKIRRVRRKLWNAVFQATFIVGFFIAILIFYLATELADETVVAWTYTDWWLRLSIYLVFACLPGGLYIRFVNLKLGPLYQEYVLNLHRLKVDGLDHLPAPPERSVYRAAWVEKRKEATKKGEVQESKLDSPMSIYDEKFDSYFGRFQDRNFTSTLADLLPIGVAGTVFVIGWLTIILDDDFLTQLANTPSTPNLLRVAFIGAYVYNLQVLIRGYYQDDLRPGTYLGAVTRVILALTVVFVVDAILSSERLQSLKIAVAFAVGAFPLIGVQWIHQIVAQRLKERVPSLKSDYPLSNLDGLNVWYEARLLEEGIEEMENLATANVVDVIMHTRVPVGRLIDWIDQAVLQLHLQPLQPEPSTYALMKGRLKKKLDSNGDNGVKPSPARQGVHIVDLLKRYGVRAATDLEEALEVDEECGLRKVALEQTGTDLFAVKTTLAGEANLKYVRNWREAAYF